MKATPIKYSGKTKADKEGNGGGIEFSGEVSANLPETTQEAVDKWGEAVCLSKINSAVTIDYQRVCRSSEGDDVTAQTAVDSFVPGVSTGRTAGGFSKKAMMEKLMSMTPEDREALLASLPSVAE